MLIRVLEAQMIWLDYVFVIYKGTWMWMNGGQGRQGRPQWGLSHCKSLSALGRSGDQESQPMLTCLAWIHFVWSLKFYELNSTTHIFSERLKIKFWKYAFCFLLVLFCLGALGEFKNHKYKEINYLVKKDFFWNHNSWSLKTCLFVVWLQVHHSSLIRVIMILFYWMDPNHQPLQ